MYMYMVYCKEVNLDKHDGPLRAVLPVTVDTHRFAVSRKLQCEILGSREGGGGGGGSVTYMYSIHVYMCIRYLDKLLSDSIAAGSGLLSLTHATPLQVLHIELLNQHLESHLRGLSHLLIGMTVLGNEEAQK